MNDLSIFDFEDVTIRTTQIDNCVWWVLSDVCRVLELTNSRRVKSRLDDDEVCNFKLQGKGIDTHITIINESGLYSIILRSKKPNAKKFKKWITSEVLPSIRKTGEFHIKNDYAIFTEIKNSLIETMDIITNNPKQSHLAVMFSLEDEFPFVSKLLKNGKLEECGEFSFNASLDIGGNDEFNTNMNSISGQNIGDKSPSIFTTETKFTIIRSIDDTSEKVVSMKKLLENSGMDSQKANLTLRTMGIIEPYRVNGKKLIQVLTEKGLRYGVNIGTNYQKSVPKYFTSMGSEIINILEERYYR